MDRFNFFFRQKVTEGELDAAFDAIEDALFNWALDNGVVGITTGGVVTENAGTPNMTVDVSGPATIYDQTGQRISWSPTQDVDCTVDENSNSTAVTTPGNSKWLTIFAQFKRVLSDPRLDGTGASVYFSRAEGFELHVAQGAEAVTPTRPAARADEIILADVLLTFGMTQIQNSDIDDSRREWAIRTSGATNAVAVGTVEEAVQTLADHLDAGDTDLADHIAAASGQHLASAVDYAGGGAWHDGTTNPAATVEAQLDKLVSDLVATAGSDRVGSAAQAVGAQVVTDGSLYDQIGELLQLIESTRAFPSILRAGNWEENPNVTTAGHTINGIALRLMDGTSTAAVFCAVGDDGANASIATSDSPRGAFTVRAFATGGDRMNDVHRGSAFAGFVAVGRISAAGGAALETSNTNATAWTARTLTGMTAAGGEAYAVLYDETNGYWIVGGETVGGSAIVRSTDPTGVAPAYATPTTLPTVNEIRALACDGNGTVLAAGQKGNGDAIVIRSTDGGDTWTEVLAEAAPPTFSHLTWSSAHQRWVVSDGDYLWHSTNAEGTAWTAGTAHSTENNQLMADDSGLLLALGGSGWAAWSRDLGETWHEFYVEGPAGGAPFQFGGDARRLYFVGGHFLIGSEGGADLYYTLLGGDYGTF